MIITIRIIIAIILLAIQQKFSYSLILKSISYSNLLSNIFSTRRSHIVDSYVYAWSNFRDQVTPWWCERRCYRHTYQKD